MAKRPARFGLLAFIVDKYPTVAKIPLELQSQARELVIARALDDH
jgi:hypothetical protein